MIDMIKRKLTRAAATLCIATMCASLLPGIASAQEAEDISIRYGKLWNFEEGAGGGELLDKTNILGKYEDGCWAPAGVEVIPGIDMYMVPRYIDVEAAKLYRHYSDEADPMANPEDLGTPAKDSKRCIAVTTNTPSDGPLSRYLVGTRIRLSEKDFHAGEYTLKLNAATVSSDKKLYAAVFAGEAGVTFADSVTSNAAVVSSLEKAVRTIELGELDTKWSEYSGQLMIEESDFDANGYLTLVIYSGVAQLLPAEVLYLDDISLTTETAPPAKIGSTVNFAADGAEGDILLATVSDNNVIKACTVKNISNGQGDISISVPYGLEKPEVRLYTCTDGKILPMVKSIEGQGADGAEFECRFKGEWTDVSGTRYDEAKKATAQPDRRKNAKITVLDKDITLNIAVHTFNGKEFCSASGSETFDIYVPSDEDYKAVISGENTATSDKGVIGTYTKEEFERLISHKVPALEDKGTLTYRASFENNYLKNFAAEGNVQYSIAEGFANSGDKAVYVTNRENESATLKFTPPGVSAADSIYAEVFVRNDEAETEGREYRLTAEIPTASGISTVSGTAQKVFGSHEWGKLSLKLNLRDYRVPADGAVSFKIYTDQNQSYYADDFRIITDLNGALLDDADYDRYALDALSDTPYAKPVAPDDPDLSLPALKDVFKDYFKVGACTQTGALFGDRRYNAILNKHFNSTVADGAFKRSWIQRTDFTGKDLTKYDFGAADKMMQICYDTGMTDVVGHCLVWDLPGLAFTNQDENGNWVDRDTALARMKEYITKTMNHFNGKGDPSEYMAGADYQNWHIPSWDVVNEAAVNVSTEEHGAYWARGGGHINVIGKDYVKYAFEYARETDPTAELRYNDFEDWQGKRNNIMTIVRDANAEENWVDGKPLIDKIGYQCHFVPDMDPTYVRDSIEAYAGLGTRVDITEIDVASYSFAQWNSKEYQTGIPKYREFELAMIWRDAFKVFKEYSDVIDRVTLWTFVDTYSSSGSRVEYMGLFDRNYQAKPQYWAIICSDEEFYEMYPEARLAFDKTSWDFESESQSTWDIDTGAWTRVSAECYSSKTTIESGETGRYLSVPSRPETENNLGVRIKLSENQIQPGKKYTLSFKARVNSDDEANSGKNLYVAFAPLSTEIGRDAEAAEFIVSTQPIGTTMPEWGEYKATIAPTEADFENGYTVLYITTSGSVIPAGTMLGFDDISINEIQ